MADTLPAPVGASPGAIPIPTRSLDEARALARERFKSRLEAGEQIGNCDCHTEDYAAPATNGAADGRPVVGVRFRDSGRTYYFAPGDEPVAVGDWVVVGTSRGREAGRVVIAPHQISLNQLQGELKPILRRLGEEDVRRMERLKGEAGAAVKTFGAHLRARRLPLKPISAEYGFDGASLLLNYAVPERERHPDPGLLRELTRELASGFGCRVELRQVGPRDEARLLGGLGRCGRTLCCSSWLPVFPEISMNMAKTQDLPLNPGKVSGVCGRLLCCLSYENEQYKQMKAVMPRLGQPIETPIGPGIVVSLQVLKELVTVRLHADNSDVVFSGADLGLGGRPADLPRAAVEPAAPPTAVLAAPDPGVVALDNGAEPATEDAPEAETAGEPAGRRRRRRRGRRSG